MIPKPSFFSLMRYQLHALFCIIIIKRERESDESYLLLHKHARAHTLLFSNSLTASPFFQFEDTNGLKIDIRSV
jgi:hypothetical protein